MRPVSRLSLVSLTVCVVALLHAGAGLASGTTLYVKKSGNDAAPCTAAAPCLTINHAVSVAASGDTIRVGPGKYYETTVEINKDLTIKGSTWFSTQVVLTNVAIDDTHGTAALVNWGTATVTYSHFNGSHMVFGPAAGIENAGTLTVNRALIAGNEGEGLRAVHGATLPSCPTTVLTNVTITGNSYGGVSGGCGPMTLTHVTIAGNTGDGVHVHG